MTKRAYVAKLACAIYVKPNGRDADGPRTARLRRYPGHVCVRRRTVPPGLRHQYVLHVADEGREPQGLQGQRGGISQEVQAHAGTDRRRAQARLQPHAGARRQHLFHRQARRHRRPFVPASRRGHDRHHAAGLRRHDARRRPLGRRQPLADGQERAVKFLSAAAAKKKSAAASRKRKPKPKNPTKSKSKPKSAKRK